MEQTLTMWVMLILPAFSMFCCGILLSLVWKGRPALMRRNRMMLAWSGFCILAGILSWLIPVTIAPSLGFLIAQTLALFLLNPKQPDLNRAVTRRRIIGEILCALVLWVYCTLEPSFQDGLPLMVLFTLGQTANYGLLAGLVIRELKKEQKATLVWLLQMIIAGSEFVDTVLILVYLYQAWIHQPLPAMMIYLCYLTYFLNLSLSMLFVWQKKEHDGALSLMRLQEEVRIHDEYEKGILEDQQELDGVRRRCLQTARQASEYLKKGESQKAVELMSSLDEDFRKQKTLVLTPVPALNAILSQKYADCAREGISIQGEYSFEFVQDDQILELCIALGNLLDNAIRAVRVLPEDQRRIDLKICLVKGCLLIQTSNPWDPAKASQIAKSGYGQKILQRIASRYDGFFESEGDEQGDYAVSLLLPIQAG